MRKEDLKHDPELPYAFIYKGNLEARFHYETDANEFFECCGYGEVVNTTPKPKIPADAKYITWINQADNGEALIAFKYGHPDNKVWKVGWDYYDEADLISELIGDSEVVVLVPREDA